MFATVWSIPAQAQLPGAEGVKHFTAIAHYLRPAQNFVKRFTLFFGTSLADRFYA
jgi:hypothetical protein